MKVTLGKNASIFHDPVSRVTVKSGEVVELTGIQMRAKRVQAALNGGFLKVVSDNAKVHEAPKETPAIGKDATPEELQEAFVNLVKKDASTEELVAAFTKAQFVTLAAQYDIEVEKEDTKMDILSAILEEYDKEVEA
jgi:hypothetical protein